MSPRYGTDLKTSTNKFYVNFTYPRSRASSAVCVGADGILMFEALPVSRSRSLKCQIKLNSCSQNTQHQIELLKLHFSYFISIARKKYRII